jgi:glycosyltransferase involved in cell wall biosynthesis
VSCSSQRSAQPRPELRYHGPDPREIRLGYACGAIRVTLDDESESTGPRAHVSGFLAGLRSVGVTPRRYLIGEDAPRRTTAVGSGDQMARSAWRRVLVDSARLALRLALPLRARRAIGPVDLLYERQATFQEIGRSFQRRGSWWVLESNGPFWYEARTHRKTLAFVRLARWLELRAYRDADLVVAVSEALKEVIVAESGRSPRDIFVLPNGADWVRFDPARAVPRRISSSPVVGFVGYMTEWAGVEDLLRAVAAVRRTGRSVEVVLVGDGPHRAHLESVAAGEEIADAVHFVGHVPWHEVPDFMAGFDMAFSGQREMSIGSMYHSPQKLYEYQAMGLATIASDYADARSLLAGGETGWLYRPGDVSDLSRVLQSALDAGDFGHRGAEARANVVRHHGWDRRVMQLLVELDRRGMLRAKHTARMG